MFSCGNYSSMGNVSSLNGTNGRPAFQAISSHWTHPNFFTFLSFPISVIGKNSVVNSLVSLTLRASVFLW